MQQYIIGNWKMNGTKAESQRLASALLKHVRKEALPLPHIIVCPSYPYLTSVVDLLEGSLLEVGAQNCHFEKSGSFTGDVSISQLIDVGCRYVIIGHSERRMFHHESSSLIRKKLEAAVKEGLKPILCIGESAEDHKEGRTFSVLSTQLSLELPDDINSSDLLIAYEPLWAIGTGVTPTPTDVENVMKFIKHEVSARRGGEGAQLVSTLYGGSVTALNAALFLNLPDVDGLLVGGASLKPDEFWQIITAAEK